MSRDWDTFVEQAEDLLLDLDDIPDAGEEFAESVREKVEGMRDWAQEHQHATSNMWTALENMTAAVGRWLQET